MFVVSDSCFSGETEDKSGPELCKLFASDNGGDAWEIGPTSIVPDETDKIAAAVKALCKTGSAKDTSDACDVIVTVGGTGLTSRDVTIQALSPLYTLPLPSFGIAMIVGSLRITPFAALSQVSCGIIGSTIVLSVPGSRKGSKENIQQILPILPHAVATAQSDSGSSRGLHSEKGPKSSIPIAPSATTDYVPPSPSTHRGCRCEREDEDIKNLATTKNPETAVAHRQRKSPYPLISFEEALKIVLDNSQSLPALKMPVGLGLVNSILAKDVVAVENVPGYRASIVDGYAVIASDGPGIYTVISSTTAGDIDVVDQTSLLKPGQAARITTGAPLYPGADAVVMVEDTEVIEASEDGVREVRIKVNASVESGESIREIGSDIKSGQIVLRKGDKISAVGGEIGTLVAAGIPRVTSYRKPLIGIASTGDEVMDSLESSTPNAEVALHPLSPGQIRDTNRPSLLAATRALGLDVIDLGIIKDDPNVLEKRLSEAIAKCDLLITTGGVSMGERDLLKPVIEHKMSGTIHFGRIRMKPAKPTTFATIPNPKGESSKKLIFALPGNPASAMVAFYLLVLPAIKKLAGWNLDPRTNGLTKMQAIWVDNSVKLD